MEITYSAATPVKMTTVNFPEPSSDLLGLSQTYSLLWYFSMTQPTCQTARCHFTNTLTVAGSFCPFRCIAVVLHQILLENVSSSICFHRPIFNSVSLCVSLNLILETILNSCSDTYIFFPLLCFQWRNGDGGKGCNLRQLSFCV